jgi:small subunit ribosomal protein S8
MTTTSTDPIADMLTRIKNSAMVNKSIVDLPHSKIKEEIAKVLKSSRYIVDYSVENDLVGKKLTLTISDDGNSRITSIKRLSKPGRRQYSNHTKLPVIKNGRGILIVSTSKGLMTGDKARQQKLGGELICEVY